METHLYRDSQMEQELRGKINVAANERHGGAIPAGVQERIATEERHIFGNGYGTLLAVAAKLAEFSESRGCPVGSGGSPATYTWRTCWASPPSILWSWGFAGRAAWGRTGRGRRCSP